MRTACCGVLELESLQWLELSFSETSQLESSTSVPLFLRLPVRELRRRIW